MFRECPFFCHNIYFLLLMSSLHWTATKIWRSDSTMSGVCKSDWKKFSFIQRQWRTKEFQSLWTDAVLWKVLAALPHLQVLFPFRQAWWGSWIVKETWASHTCQRKVNLSCFLNFLCFGSSCWSSELWCMTSEWCNSQWREHISRKILIIISDYKRTTFP